MPSIEFTTTCPFCAAIQEVQTYVGSGAVTPHPGALSLCWACVRWAVYDDGPYGLTVRRPTDTELVEIGADRQATRVRAAALQVKAGRRAVDE